MSDIRAISVRAVANGWLVEVLVGTQIVGAQYVSRDPAGVVEIIAQALRVDAEVKRDE